MTTKKPEKLELHKVIYFDTPGLSRFNIKNQLKKALESNSEYEIHEIEVNRGVFYPQPHDGNPIQNEPPLIITFVGYHLAEKPSKTYDINNDDYECNIYWSASDCYVFCVKHHDELTKLHIIYDVNELLETLISLAADPLFCKNDMIERLLFLALNFCPQWAKLMKKYSGGMIEIKELKYLNETVNNLKEFIDYAVLNASEYKPFIYYGTMKNMNKVQNTAVFMGVGYLVANSYEPLEYNESEKNYHDYIKSVKNIVRIYNTPNQKLISLQFQKREQALICRNDGIETTREHIDKVIVRKASCSDLLYPIDFYKGVGLSALAECLDSASSDMNFGMLEYSLLSTNQHDIKFTGSMVDYAIIRETKTTPLTILRVFLSFSAIPIFHKLEIDTTNSKQTGFVLVEKAGEVNDSKVVELFGLSDEAKELYRNVGINAYLEIE